MALLLDTGILYAYYDRSDRWHEAAHELIETHAAGLVVPAPVLPEADYLLGRRLGGEAQRLLYRAIVDGHYLVADLPKEGYARIAELCDRYRDLRLGFVDAAVMALAEHLGLGRVATTDRRHFAAVDLRLEIELLPAVPE